MLCMCVSCGGGDDDSGLHASSPSLHASIHARLHESQLLKVEMAALCRFSNGQWSNGVLLRSVFLHIVNRLSFSLQAIMSWDNIPADQLQFTRMILIGIQLQLIGFESISLAHFGI